MRDAALFRNVGEMGRLQDSVTGVIVELLRNVLDAILDQKYSDVLVFETYETPRHIGNAN